jgi:polar amino acid transport system substrate-binding protein
MRAMPLLLALMFLALALQSPAGTLAPTGVLRAAYLATNPVQARRDAGGTWTGPVPDLVRELARRHNLSYELLPQPDAGTVIARVKGGQADIGFLAYEAARATQVDFSEPYALMANAYLVRADSSIRTSADVDRAGVRVAAVKGQSQQIFVSERLQQAQVLVLPTVPPNDQIVALLEKGEADAFAANRQRMQEAARTSPTVRVLPDNFFMIGQALVVDTGQTARLAELNRFVADVRRSGLVRESIERAGLTGNVEVPR